MSNETLADRVRHLAHAARWRADEREGALYRDDPLFRQLAAAHEVATDAAEIDALVAQLRRTPATSVRPGRGLRRRPRIPDGAWFD